MFKSTKLNSTQIFILLMRFGIFGTFFGHGINAFFVKKSWIPLITTFGFSEEFAIRIMPFIGLLDVVVALCILFKPTKLVIIWAILWTFITALSRPLSGEPIAEFIERAANWTLPLILLLYTNKITTENKD